MKDNIKLELWRENISGGFFYCINRISNLSRGLRYHLNLTQFVIYLGKSYCILSLLFTLYPVNQYPEKYGAAYGYYCLEQQKLF